jgi:uncharacterized protein YjdB
MKHIIYFFLLSILFSCEKEQPQVTSIRLDKSDLELYVGEEYQFVVYHEDSNAPTPQYIWNISDKTIATISNNGLLKVFNNGNLDVTVSTSDVFDNIGNPFITSCKVKINPILASGIRFEQDTFFIKVGEALQLPYSFIPANTTHQDVVWSSSNEHIAKISQSGIINGGNIGQTTVTIVSKEDNRIKTSCIVKVLERPLEGIALDRTEINNVVAGLKEKLSIKYIPECATNKKVKWESSDPTIATVDENGVVSLLTAGTCIITVTSEDGNHTASCLINIPYMKVTGISFQKEKYEIGIGQSFPLKNEVSVYPSYATNKNFTLRCSAGTDVVSLNSHGIITGLKEGTAVFYAKSQDGGYESPCFINVVDPIIAAVNMSMSFSGWANIGGYFTSHYQCTVTNNNNDPIILKAFRAIASEGSDEYVLHMHKVVSPNSTITFEGHFNSIYEPFYLLFFEYKGICCYVKKFDN